MGARGSCFCVQHQSGKDVDSLDQDRACDIPELPSRRHSGIPPPPPRQRSRTLSNATAELVSALSSPRSRLRKYGRKQETASDFNVAMCQQSPPYSALPQDAPHPNSNPSANGNTLRVPYGHSTIDAAASVSGISELSLTESPLQCTTHVFAHKSEHFHSDNDQDEDDEDDDEDDDAESSADESEVDNEEAEDSVERVVVDVQERSPSPTYTAKNDDDENGLSPSASSKADVNVKLSPASAAAVASAHLLLTPNLSHMSGASELSQLSSADTLGHAEDGDAIAACTIILTSADRHRLPLTLTSSKRRTRERDSSLSTQSAPATLMTTHKERESSISSMHQPDKEELDELDDDSDLEADAEEDDGEDDGEDEVVDDGVETEVEAEPTTLTARWKTSIVSDGSAADLDQRPSITTCSAVEHETHEELQKHLMLNVKSNNRLGVVQTPPLSQQLYSNSTKSALECEASYDSCADSPSSYASNSSMSPQPDDIISDAYSGVVLENHDSHSSPSLHSNIVVDEMTKYLAQRQKNHRCVSPKQAYID